MDETTTEKYPASLVLRLSSLYFFDPHCGDLERRDLGYGIERGAARQDIGGRFLEVERDKHNALRGPLGNHSLHRDGTPPRTDLHLRAALDREGLRVGGIDLDIRLRRHSVDRLHAAGHAAGVILEQLPPRGQDKRIFLVRLFD